MSVNAEPRAAEDRSDNQSVLSALSVDSSSHLFLHVLISDHCNHACQHCYQVHGQHGEMSFEQIATALHKFREGGGFVVEFSGGEATLREDLIDLLEHAHGLGLATVLYTNGFTMTAELAARIAKANVWRVDISLYSHHAHEHDAVTLVPGSWDKTTAGIRHLRQLGVVVRVKVPLLATCTSTLPELQEMASRLGCELSVADQLTDREGADAAPLALKMAPEHLASMTAPFSRGPNLAGTSSCGAGKQGLTLRSDGVFQPCTSLFVELNRVDDADGQPEHRVANETQALFARLTWDDLHGCRDCAIQVHCSRCHASALAERGDMFGPYPGACELAAARYAQAHGIERETNEAGLGPFTIGPDRRLHTGTAVLTQADLALRSRFPFIRQSRSNLLQIRKKPGEPPLDRSAQRSQ